MEPVSYAALDSSVGAVVGVVEILQRYRDAPLRAVCSGGGVDYVVLNAAVSYGAFRVLYHWIETPRLGDAGQPDALHLLGLAAGAGFGGATPTREARHHSPPERTGVGFGPVIVVETLLSVVDRQPHRQLTTVPTRWTASSREKWCRCSSSSRLCAR